jgi:hypothetical protein
MDSLIFKLFIPEIFLSLCILFQLLINSYIITNLKNNFPLLNKESFYQVIYILICLLALLFNSQIEGGFSNFLFLILSLNNNQVFHDEKCRQ